MGKARLMIQNRLRPVATFGGRPIHAMLVPFPIVCFTGTLVTDLVYWSTNEVFWLNCSDWLLAAGLIFAAFAVVAGVIDFAGSRAVRTTSASWLHGLGNLVAVALAFLNVLVHSRDGYTAVVPEGLILSALVVLILLFTSWMGWTMVYRNNPGHRQNSTPKSGAWS